MNWISAIGILAAILTTGAFVPQAYKTVKTKSTGDLSLATFSLLFIGTIMWLTYGLIIGDFPLVLANAITSVLCGLIFYVKIMEMRRK